MAALEEALAAAEASLAEGNPREALQHCKAALKADKRSVEAFILIGRAAHAIQEYGQAELAYRKALEVAPDSLAAWSGLARLYATTANTQGAVEANERALSLLPEEDMSHAQHEIWLADAYYRVGRYQEAVRQYRQLLDRTAEHPEAAEALPEHEGRLDLLCRMADIQLKLDEARAVEEVEARMAMAAEPPAPAPPGAAAPAAAAGGPGRTVSNLQLEVLSQQALTDEAAAAGTEASGSFGGPAVGSTAATLLELCSAAPLAERFVKYHEEWLKRCLLKIFSAPPRSVERQHFRLAALRECHTCMWKAGCSALPYEAAVWLLEEEEEIKGGHVPVGGQVVGSSCALAGGVQEGGEGHLGGGQQAVLYAFENFARRFYHQHPTNPTAQVCLGLMLRRRGCSDGSRPVPQALRRQIEGLLRRAMEDDSRCDSGTGWKALAEVQYENRHYPEAYETAVRGLRWLHSRRERGHEALTHVALSLRLVVAKALRRMSRLDEAETHFKVLAGWVTEGEAAFGEMSGSAPVSIHQQALRGIALVALERGDRGAAKAQYERILGKAALGRGPAEHWAHADYGWLLFQEGDIQGARQQLEDAIRVATSGCTVTDSQLAEHHYRLGEVYWRMRGRYRSEKQFAYAQFFDAASVEGHAQAPAFAALGRYFQEVEGKPEQAMRCYKRALALDPAVAAAGDHLCAMLVGSGKADTALTLCREIVARAPQARWAHRRAGYLLAAAERFEEGVTSFQAALKTDVGDAAAWEGLASCYQNLGRFTAALKAYTRSLELQPERPYARIQCGAIHMALGAPAEAAAQFEQALQVAPSHPAALLGAAESLAASAGLHSRQGALGTAADELAQAASLLLQCTTKQGTLQAAWKLLGDVLVAHHSVTPSPAHPTIPDASSEESSCSQGQAGGAEDQDGSSFVDGQLRGWQRRVQAVQQARRAYAKALHLDPAQPGAWLDAAFAFHHEAQLRRAQPAAEADSSAGLVASAERSVRSGLRLDAASAHLWSALGSVAAEPAAREYALSRALQLDPKCVPAWVALARLYAEHGAGGPAAAALQHARSHEPAVPAIWEAMADVAALSATGAQDRADYQEHAHGLGAGPAGLLGYAESSVRAGRAAAGPVYAAAKKAAHMQPLNPAAHNVLGLVSEARGDYATAVASYRRALRLLLGARPGPDSLLQHPSTVAVVGGAAASLQTALQLNLARALVGAGAAAAAVDLFDELEVSAELYDQPPSWLAFAAAKSQAGDLAGAELAARPAEQPGTPAPLLACAVRATMQLHCQAGRPTEALAHLERSLPLLREGRVLAEDMEALWLTAAAGAAAARDAGLLQQALVGARAWALQADHDCAAFQARLLAVAAAGGLAARETGTAARQYAQAVHLCPADPCLRLGLAAAVLMRPADGSSAADRAARAALRLLESPAVAQAVAGAGGLRAQLVAPSGKPLPEAAVEAGTSALLSSRSSCPQQLRQRLSVAARCVHESPGNARLWQLAAVTARKAAAMEGGGDEADGLRAWRWCRAAEGAALAQAVPLTAH